MKIALINGSPKVKESASDCVLQGLISYLGKEHNIIATHFKSHELKVEQMEILSECDVLVFAFPLYVDGIPSHLLHCLMSLQEYLLGAGKKEIMVYALVNCGFYEGKQNALAIEMMQHWCKRSSLKWGQGVGIGAGGMLLSLKNVPPGHGPNKNLGNTFETLSANILKSAEGKTVYMNTNFPRFAYKIGAEMGWRKMVKDNGLKRRDLFRQIGKTK